MSDPLSRTPVTIVTGFLGSGKTTLLNQLLTGVDLGRVAALVNDFGSVNIDAALVAQIADDVIQLSNGCVCCTINGDLFAAAERVLALEPRVDRIVVETTGLADPLPVGLTFLQTTLNQRTVLDAVLTVVDCANFALDLFKVDAAMAQIVHGDIIILNKADLVTPDQIESLERRIRVIKPRARVLRAKYGNVPATVILGQAAGGASLVPKRGSNYRHISEDTFRAHVYQFEGSLSPQRFQSWLDRSLPAGVFRAKGLVQLDGYQGAHVFQLCGTRSAFEPYEKPIAQSSLVFIGTDIDATQLGVQLEACIESGARTRNAGAG